MSGGCYGYFYSSFGDDGSKETLKTISDRLAELGHPDVAADTRRVLDLIESLSEVWRDVEWLDSGDYSEDQVAETVGEYRSSRDAAIDTDQILERAESLKALGSQIQDELAMIHALVRSRRDTGVVDR